MMQGKSEMNDSEECPPSATSCAKRSRWKKTVADQLFDVSTVDGFFMLEELTDYKEDELNDILKGGKRKRHAKLPNKDDVINTKNPESFRSVGVKHEENVESVNAPKVCDNPKRKKEDDFSVTALPMEQLSKSQKKRLALKEKQRKKKLMKLKEKMKRRKQFLAGSGTASEIECSATGSSDMASKASPSLSMALTKKSRKKSQAGSSLLAATNLVGAETTCEVGGGASCMPDMSDWLGLDVSEPVIKALAEKNFVSPTPIQKLTLPSAIAHRRDIIGAAETGSGKTLAFGIPLITLISNLKAKRPNISLQSVSEEKQENPLLALVLAPTRELAIQVHDHIKDAAKYTNVRCVVVVGGMAAVKQQRLLSERPDIVVATPGRLHKLMIDGEFHLSRLGDLKFLVIDECDRMLERGHFKELTEILSRVNAVPTRKQKFVFSATLTLPQHHRKGVGVKCKTPVNDIQALIDAVGLDHKAKVVDLTTKSVTATLLKQRKVICNNEEKDMFLFYFLLTHPGRTIVFANSISCTKKLYSLYSLLGYDPLLLHAGKQQRQRLKSLDRFVERENGLLIATDVASRGLDVPKVQYVVHYQLPVDPKVYIHRAGRTARAQELGLSLILEGPEDYQAYQKILRVLNLEEDIEPLSVDGAFFDAIKARVELAKRIEKEEFKVRRASADSSWAKRTAKSLDIEVDELGGDVPAMSKQQRQVVSQMKRELQRLLKSEIYPKGFSGSYPTRLGLLNLPGLKANTK